MAAGDTTALYVEVHTTPVEPHTGKDAHLQFDAYWGYDPTLENNSDGAQLLISTEPRPAELPAGSLWGTLDGLGVDRQWPIGTVHDFTVNLDYTSDSGVMADDVQVRVDIGDGLRVTPPDEFVADESQPGTYQLRAPTALTHRDHKTYPWKVEAVSQAYSSHINVDVTTSTPGVLTHGNYADVDVATPPDGPVDAPAAGLLPGVLVLVPAHPDGDQRLVAGEHDRLWPASCCLPTAAASWGTSIPVAAWASGVTGKARGPGLPPGPAVMLAGSGSTR